MKKFVLSLFVALAVIAFGTGSAHADRGFWFHSTAAGWTTYFNVTNTSASSTTATVTFYPIAGSNLTTALVAVGSTTATIMPGGQWNFNTGNIGNITTASLEAAVRGAVKISGTVANAIHGHTTQANATYSGFDLTIQSGTANADIFSTTGE